MCGGVKTYWEHRCGGVKAYWEHRCGGVWTGTRTQWRSGVDKEVFEVTCAFLSILGVPDVSFCLLCNLACSLLKYVSNQLAHSKM